MTRLTHVERFFHVPDTWEAWAIRVLTVMLTLVLISIGVLINQLADLSGYISESRSQRLSFQQEETARQCAMLRALGTTPDTLRSLRC